MRMLSHSARSCRDHGTRTEDFRSDSKVSTTDAACSCALPQSPAVERNAANQKADAAGTGPVGGAHAAVKPERTSKRSAGACRDYLHCPAQPHGIRSATI